MGFKVRFSLLVKKIEDFKKSKIPEELFLCVVCLHCWYDVRRLCGPINASSVLDRADFFSAVGDELPLIVMDYAEYIPDFCTVMVNTSMKDVLERYATAIGMFEEEDAGCINCKYWPDIRTLRAIRFDDVTATG